MGSNLTQEMMQFVAEATRTKIERLTLDTQLEWDLGVTGDDADEFMQKYASEFNVDMTDFEFNKYFGGEGVGFPPLLLIRLLIIWWRQKPLGNRLPITISKLISAAETGKWPIEKEQ